MLLVAGLSLGAVVRAVSNRRGVVRLPGLSMGICVGKCATETGSVRVLRFSHVTFSPPFRRTLLYLDATSIRRTNGRSIGTFKESGVVSDVREHFPGKYCHIIFGRSLLHFISFVKEWGK